MVAAPVEGGAQAGDGVEVLEECLRDDEEAVTATHVVEVRHQLAAGILPGAEEADGLEMIEVPEKLFTVEAREGAALLRIHPTSWRDEAMVRFRR
jgi:hypothetical protein